MLMRYIALAIAAAVALAGTPALAQQAHTIELIGEAETHAAPDTAFVSFGVTTEAETAAAALAANNTAMRQALDTVKAEGIAARDVQTSGLVLAPRYGSEQPPNKSERRIIGYTATNAATVRVRDLAKLGSLLDQIVKAGANQIRGIDFDIADRARLMDELRRRAVADARAKANLYAAAAGVKLGPLVRLTEEGAPSPSPLRRKAMAAASVPVEAGELTLTMRVRMVWNLAN
jgi:uncharacterized protein YggE